MKFLLDQNVSARVADLLRQRGHEAIHTRDVNLSTAEDAAILEWCRNENRIVITMDADFHALLALAGATTPSVIRIRIESLPDDEFTALVERVIANFGEPLGRGAAVTVKETSIRVHLLPLVRDSN